MTTLVSWPARLPLPTFDGYALEPQDATSRTDMEAGPARQRRRFTGTPTRIPVRWRFRDVDFATFEAWFRLKLADGADWFAISLLGGIGIAAHEARFVGQGNAPYKAVPGRGGVWIVTSVLEIRERPMLDEGALDILLAEDVSGLLAAIDALHSTVHAGLPGANPW
ncbi:hypothetical protein [Magnetospirillum sp. LM-5]|uniref:hypothetical protein n=1 Tax=Magnetospirillum sp. LM-5 TaxID=2681466 RepID=UPI0015709CD3|nr:hypothetical protein [Magnetospirillum sp. LM-5]